MKTKDFLGLALLAVVLIFVGSILIGKLTKSNQHHTAQVEVVQPIDPSFSADATDILLGHNSTYKVKSYTSLPNLKSGFGNTNPFKAQ